ncbi:hypothetical protein KUCAC02_016645, partial [Chaenocephalus aceratus]
MQQESRPLLSPSIDDFLSETRSDAPPHGPPTSNTAALDLVDLSEPGGPVVVRPPRRSPLRRKAVSRSPRRRADPEETELIQVEPRTPERVALDPVSPPVNGWDE